MRIEAFLRQSPIVQASRMARRMEASLNLVLKDEGVTAFEALVLAAIFFEKRGEINPSALAEAFETTRSNVSHCISSLEAKGLVRAEDRSGGCAGGAIGAAAAGQAAGGAGGGDSGPDAAAV